MKYRSANNIFLQNALIVSIIVHGAGIYIMLIWTTAHKPHVLEFKPIQITKIVYESSLELVAASHEENLPAGLESFASLGPPEISSAPSSEQKMEKVVAPVSIPVEKIFTKANAAKPMSARPLQEIKPTQPIAAVMASVLRQKTYSPDHAAKEVKPFTVQSTEPAYLHVRTFADKIRYPNKSVQLVSVLERVGIPGNALQRPVTENVMKRSSIIPVINSKIGARNISGEKSLFIASGKRYPEAVSDIRKASASHVQPVQLTSMPEELVAASREENLPAGLESFASLGPPEISGAPSSKNLELLSKSFSDSVWGKISTAKFYPKIARRHGWEGKPVIEFQIGKNGNLVSYSIAVASPYEVLNQAALDAVKNASPYPIPEPLQSPITFKILISFSLRER